MKQQAIIAQVVQHLRPGGIETLALDLMRYQPAKTIIISLEGTHQQAIAQWPILQSVQANLVFLNKQPGYQWHLLKKLQRLFKQYEIDAVHTHHIGPLLYAGLAARLTGISTVIHTEHDAWHLSQLKRRLLERLLLTVIRPIFVADANEVANKVAYYLGRKQVRVIPNGIDLDKFSPGESQAARRELNLPEQAVIIGSAGRLEKVKGHDILINALWQLPDHIQLVIAGSGSCESALRKQTLQYNIEHRVHFLGAITDMPLFYRALDLFCLPSRSEGMPLAPLEAQACGIPTLLTNVGGSSEALCSTTGLLVKENQPDKMASSILTLLKRYKQPQQASPRKFVEQHNNIKNVATKYYQLVNPIN